MSVKRPPKAADYKQGVRPMQRLHRFATLTLIGVFSSVIAGPGSAEATRTTGVRNASHCIKVTPGRGGYYRIANSCTYGVNLKLQTESYWPRVKSVHSYSVAAGGSFLAVSYYDSSPVVISACGKGSVC